MRQRDFSKFQILLAGALFLLFLSLGLPFLKAQEASPSASKTAASDVAESGLPVTDKLVLNKCGACHQPDAKGNMSRISWIRTTPEGWEEAIKRMVRLHNVSLEPDEARKILRYLSDEHGLAPGEAKKVQYFAEHRMVDEEVPNEDVKRSCVACHALAKPLSWRRSADDWKMLVNTHIAFFPWTDSMNFQRPPRRPGALEEVSEKTKRAPVEEALEFLAKSGSLHSPEWAEWSANMHTPRLAGHWLIAGSQPGKGKFFGTMDAQAMPSGEGFLTKTTLEFPGDGSVWMAAGKSIVYTGYAWRGRSKSEKSAAAPNDPVAAREVMMLSRDQSQMEGRWFWGAYEEFGMDVRLRRAAPGPTVLGVDTYALKTGTTSARVRIFGDHFSNDISVADIDLGPGVKVKKITANTPELVTLSVDVDPHAVAGKRDVAVRDAVAPAAFAVYEHMDYLKVTPQTALSHLGGEPHGKGYSQFEAIAYANGPDGKSNTPDDIELGPVKAEWKLDEFVATIGDDDVEFVGQLDSATGLFTPALDGPNPKRKFSRNNYGDVWVVASYKPDGAEPALTSRSYLVVAVPQYVRWDQPEVGQ